MFTSLLNNTEERAERECGQDDELPPVPVDLRQKHGQDNKNNHKCKQKRRGGEDVPNLRYDL